MVTSQRVAPSAYIASLWVAGTDVITSRETATIVGRIMIARMTPAANSPIPSGGPSNRGITRPMVPTMTASIVVRRKGVRM